MRDILAVAKQIYNELPENKIKGDFDTFMDQLYQKLKYMAPEQMQEAWGSLAAFVNLAIPADGPTKDWHHKIIEILEDTEIKVFQMNDYDWWAARTEEEAKESYLKETGMDPSEAYPEECFHQLTTKEMARLKYHWDEGREIISFHDALCRMKEQRQKFPCMFASTEC